MDAKKIVLLVGALIIAVTTALLARNMLSSSSTPSVNAANMPVEADQPHVLVAVKALPVGTILDAESFRFQPWPKDLVEQAYYLRGQADPARLAGSVIRTAITAGQPLTQGSLVKPGDRGFLAAALAPGMRAVTVPVSAQTSVAGFVFPGDRIDLVLTQSVAGGGDGEPLKVSETILRNLRVLATDQRMDALGPDGKPVVQTYSNVTLEVTPKIAEKIAVAQTVGSLSMSLRSMADTPSDLDAAIAGADVDLPEGASPAAEKAILAKLAARPVDRGSTYSTGADVSRYQRSSVPAKAEAPVPPAMAANGAPVGTVAFKGPTIRVARGTTVTEVPVGGK
ncbi:MULTISPECIES: Flp pilus assembly protein CpaB [Sphingomonadaceae]|jgi:pilus assembly protein CpaB|uniref:Flp pilus assembly protein CpaB n=1 Tax=Sphingomonadales TaxID=204457 RepID=UPI0000D7BBF9|nr:MULTISPECIES: Flp pilus assembly protein CpaB [Sphingomonadaceae]EAT08387.1 Flp pilus assembly CpaB [Sphingomonas sp. SKA58]MAX15304.1 Flp pilus assembly protein CpaB [Sphingobium sp.]MBA37381.1 Flp pilus assembly protein CpaB [Sphingobium sp.]MBS48018.1 Flp pilus assembly protein CpaB [Sphingobium sp.]MCC4255507.1 Flp pilus assembly protein CpaB [Sphingobium lactosutens]